MFLLKILKIFMSILNNGITLIIDLSHAFHRKMNPNACITEHNFL